MKRLDDEVAQARERLLDVLLAEELETRQPAAGLLPREALRPRVANVSGPRRVLIAAAVVLGVVAVLATAWAQRSVGPDRNETEWALPRQDPQDPGQVVVRDVAHLRELLQQATAFRLERREIIGAAQVAGAQGVGDELELESWPETATFTKAVADTFEGLRSELTGSLGKQQDQNRVGDVLRLVVELPDDRHVSAFVSVDGSSTYFSFGELDPFVPTDALRANLIAALEEIVRRHEMARGVARALADLERLPTGSRRIEVQALEDIALLRRFTDLRVLRLRGESSAALLGQLEALSGLEELELDGAALDDAHVRALGRCKGLRVLTLRHCSGFDDGAVRALRGLSSLRSLQCIDSSPEASAGVITGLASLPSLREFGLRDGSLVLTPEVLEPLLRTKLQRLLLVDVTVTGEDLLGLKQLPTLRELELVCRLDDDDLAGLGELAGLRRLLIRNADVTQDGIDTFRAARPACAIDARPNARFFDTARAFGPIQ